MYPMTGIPTLKSVNVCDAIIPMGKSMEGSPTVAEELRDMITQAGGALLWADKYASCR